MAKALLAEGALGYVSVDEGRRNQHLRRILTRAPKMRRSAISRTLAGLLLTATGIARAQQVATHENHGAHEEAPAPRLGEIDFPTAASPGSHPEFVHGVLLMHNFHYPAAAAAFR